MAGGLQTTFDVLKSTHNEAAAPVLIAALDAPRREIREAAFPALLARRSLPGQHEIVRRWHALDEAWKEQIAQRPGSISPAVRDAILGTDAQLGANGCSAVTVVRDFDLMPALVNAAENPTCAHASLAASAILSLADVLYEELAAPRDYSRRRDPQLLRQYVVGVLEQSVARFSRHKRREILEAFLVLANRDNSTLKRVLQNPHDAAYLPLVDMLTHGSRPGIMRLALGYLDDPHAPLTSLNVLGRRCDEPFLRHLLSKVGFEPSQQAKANIKRMDSIGWVRENPALVDGLSDAHQHAAVQLAVGSAMSRQYVYKLLERILECGTLGGRRAASAALAEFKGIEANQLVLKCLADPDPQVRANLIRQLRERAIPGAITRLIEAVESREPLVRAAARESLAEFTFKRYLSAFDTLEPEARRGTGALVRLVDPNALDGLRQELSAAGRSRRLRAIEVCLSLDAAAEVEHALIERLQDEDHFVRAEAATALARCDSASSRAALREALLDRSVTVQEAAEASLRALTGAHAREIEPPVRETYLEPPGVIAQGESPA